MSPNPKGGDVLWVAVIPFSVESDSYYTFTYKT